MVIQVFKDTLQLNIGFNDLLPLTEADATKIDFSPFKQKPGLLMDLNNDTHTQLKTFYTSLFSKVYDQIQVTKTSMRMLF